ncbi:hypothetical protein Ccrd_021883 [Cynara cardunculus var. scolymus]|uniref:Transmembrane protein n=1 Tax=Cynara cardunculus var. scolymus TaxID=59895 RepID=A0A118JZV5_CYNCS|nr:hypothetical protein Ccrd_021883 [Cynara cardunculus var. scolymus]
MVISILQIKRSLIITGWFCFFHRRVFSCFLQFILLQDNFGITVAYTAPTRHGCLKVVENNYCAPNRGGVRCLFILNFMFAIAFGLLAIFLGSTLLTLGRSGCSIPLFWCYEIASWGLVTLYGVTASLLRRKTVMVLDDGDLGGQMIGVEMLEANPVEFTPEMERRVNEGFRSWMGTSYLSDDEEDEEYLEVSHMNSYRRRV